MTDENEIEQPSDEENANAVDSFENPEFTPPEPEAPTTNPATENVVSDSEAPTTNPVTENDAPETGEGDNTTDGS